MNKHTPGPWLNDCFDVIFRTSEGYGEKLLTPKRKRENSEEYKANLQLMTAAPELLEAAKYILEAFKTGAEDVCDIALNDLTSAIKKAEGK